MVIRNVVFLLTLGAAFGIARDAEAQGQKTVRVGRLSPISAETDVANLAAFRGRMRELGWEEGRNFTLIARFADGRATRLPELAAELVRERVDIILAARARASLRPSARRAPSRSSWLPPEIRLPTAS